MKTKVILILFFLFNALIATSQNLNELLRESKVLTELFVYPLGINIPFDELNSSNIKMQLDSLHLKYTNDNLGSLGDSYFITPTDFKVDNVYMDNVFITIGDGMNYVMYISSPSDKYMDVFDYYNNICSRYSSEVGSKYSSDSKKVYYISDEYGIAVGISEKKKTVIAMLIDLKNMEKFMSFK